MHRQNYTLEIHIYLRKVCFWAKYKMKSQSPLTSVFWIWRQNLRTLKTLSPSQSLILVTDPPCTALTDVILTISYKQCHKYLSFLLLVYGDWMMGLSISINSPSSMSLVETKHFPLQTWKQTEKMKSSILHQTQRNGTKIFFVYIQCNAPKQNLCISVYQCLDQMTTLIIDHFKKSSFNIYLIHYCPAQVQVRSPKSKSQFKA